MIAGRIIRKKRIEYIDIEKIVTGKFTLRRYFDQEKIDRLARSVENFGILQPVTVRKFGKSYELISGERRVMAAKAAGLMTVPAMLVDTRFDIATAIAIAENQQREELNLLDTAESFMSLIRRRGLTYSEMADIIGVSPQQVSEKITVMQLPRRFRDILSVYDLTKEHLEAISILEDEEEAARLLEEAGENRYSPDKLKEVAKESFEEKRVRKQVVKDVKIYLNTINQAVEMIKKSGMYANAERHDNEQYIEYVIKIEK
ncbi:MAG: ParB/RepB/Spo0J family partition protein [Clostridia bacterium]|nr:ParB/RepB/Spo0J family partition protein [Clostridia bacterium]